ncbi:hypothetical protein ACQJBY_002342 [Aegilops geniculata]
MGCKQKRRRAATWDDGDEASGRRSRGSLCDECQRRGTGVATGDNLRDQQFYESGIADAFSSSSATCFELAGSGVGAVTLGLARVHWRGAPPQAEPVATAVDSGWGDAGERRSFLFLAVAWGSDLDPTGLNCCIGWLGADRPKISAGAPAPSSRLSHTLCARRQMDRRPVSNVWGQTAWSLTGHKKATKTENGIQTSGLTETLISRLNLERI